MIQQNKPQSSCCCCFIKLVPVWSIYVCVRPTALWLAGPLLNITTALAGNDRGSGGPRGPLARKTPGWSPEWNETAEVLREKGVDGVEVSGDGVAMVTPGWGDAGWGRTFINKSREWWLSCQSCGGLRSALRVTLERSSPLTDRERERAGELSGGVRALAGNRVSDWGIRETWNVVLWQICGHEMGGQWFGKH